MVVGAKAMKAPRFPPPWTAELTPNCFIVRDADGQQLAYVYYESEPGRRSSQSALLSSRCLSSRSLGGHYCAGLDRSLNARVRLSEQTVRHSSVYVRQTSPGWVAELFFAPFPHCRGSCGS